VRRRLLAACLFATLLGWPRTVAEAHPIHTTLTQLAYDRGARSVTISVRVFADDFGTAIQRHSGGRGSFDQAALAYARRTLTLSPGGKKALPLSWCGARQQGIVVWLCLRAPARGLEGLVVHNRMHFELFDDQVNIVQATVDGRRRSLLFTRGDRPKRLR
jgi:hypothetical protein